MSAGTAEALGRSQPTYEELKREDKIQFCWTVVSSQPTYEELKPPPDQDLPGLGLGSQPTYEELKLSCSPDSYLEIIVLSLPMRN